MEQFLYERPREKLRSRGAKFLTLPELIQIIIGSGSSRVSGAKLARRIASLMQPGSLVSLEQLLTVQGVGVAKASQIIAAIELGARVARVANRDYSSPLTTSEATQLLVAAARDGPEGIFCVWLNGSSQEIDRKRYAVNLREHMSVSVRRLFLDVISVSAHEIIVVLYYKSHSLSPTIPDLEAVKLLRDTANVLNVKVNDILIANKQAHKSWKNEI